MIQTTKLDRLFSWFSTTYPNWEFQMQYKVTGVELRVWRNTATERIENSKLLKNDLYGNSDIEILVKDAVVSMISEVSR